VPLLTIESCAFCLVADDWLLAACQFPQYTVYCQLYWVCSVT